MNGINGLHKLALAALVSAGALLAGASAHAQLLNGSLPLSGIVVTQNGANLAVSTTISTAFDITSGFGDGDYSPIPLGTTFSDTSLILASPTSYSISNAVWGSFVASSSLLVMRTPSFYDVELFGTYTPGSGLPGFVATPAQLRISINQSGSSLSEAITLSSPPLDVPEPGSVAMLVGMGLSGAGFLIRRRRK